jgi:Putative prokaryotic signal transducing protein
MAPSKLSKREMSEEFVEVRRCTWLHEAEFLKSVLEAAGIEARIPDEYTLGVQPLYANMLDGVRLLVRADDLERASEILDWETHKKDSNEG